MRLLAGFLIGLIIGAGIVLISALLDKRLRDSSRAANNFGFPVVAEIPLPSKMNGECDVSALELAECVRFARRRGLPDASHGSNTGGFGRRIGL